MDVKEPLILHIETSTDICSVALSRGKDLQSLVESGQERSHATQLNSFIKEALSQAGAAMKDLQAVAVSKGPGSYTGLRIGVSTAKGIAYALQIPLLASLTLLNMASGIRSHPLVRKLISEKETAILLCPLLDARRMEVYSAFYTPALVSFREVSADIIEPASYASILKKHQVCFFGNGMAKSREALEHPHAHFIEDIHPSAASMCEPVYQLYQEEKFEDVAYFEPYYLKDFIATVPKKKVL